MDARLILDAPSDGAWNMAVDETLLSRPQASRRPTLRFYDWTLPTLSLGYFQSVRDREQHAGSSGLSLVRRASGGGAIVHDQELTYSYVCQHASQPQRLAERLYADFHETLIAALAELGVPAVLCLQPAVPTPQPFLCFRRHTPGDVLCERHKICGSAQRRRQGVVLQHGSVLLTRSKNAPELPGIQELSPATRRRKSAIDSATLMDTWLPRLAQRLGLHFHPDELDRSERREAEQAWENKFTQPTWNERR